MECDICADIASKKSKASKQLKELTLDCWQREYGRRPYDHLIFHGNVFERKFFRKMTADDFVALLQFLVVRAIQHFEFLNCTVPAKHTQSFLKCLDNLVSVNFTNSKVPMEMFRYMAENAKHLNLKTLMLCGNQIDEQQSEYFRTYLLETEKLEHFDVSDCGINHITLAIIADGVLHCKTLKSIDLSSIVPHHPHQIMDSSKISVILSILIWSSRLSEVHYRKARIDGSGMGMISENIPISFLRILDIGANSIGPDGTTTLFRSLEHSNVVALLMPFNNIGDVGGNVIAKSLRFTKLQHLDISYNKISSSTMELILTTLTKCNGMNMNTLNIYGNDFSSPAIGSVLHILITNHILNPDGLDVAVNCVDGLHQIFPVENQMFNNFQKSRKLSKFCVNEKVNSKSLMWFKENLRHVVNCQTKDDEVIEQNFCKSINQTEI